MSFFTKLNTELKNKQYVLAAIAALKQTGEIKNYAINEKKESVEINRAGDIIQVVKTKTGEYELQGDARVVSAFSSRLKQLYAYEAIKDNMPLDFEIAEEIETAGEIRIVLKG
ncbi:MAG: hypothetical protein OEV59_03850 [Deltaproteobacteria bacterium]|nr:hypothetical protein [Deltaproteobacteria bacterium]